MLKTVFGIFIFLFVFAVPAEAQKRKTTTRKRPAVTTARKRTATARSAAAKPASIKGLQSERDRIKKQIRQHEQRLRINERDVKKRLQSLMMLNTEIADKRKSIDTIKRVISELDFNIIQHEDRLDELNAQLDDKKQKYVKSMRYMHRNRSLQNKLMFVFSAKNFTQMYRRLRFMREYATYQRVSRLLGAVKMSVTMITAGTQHNVVPDECRFVIDVRTNELYDNREVFDIIRSHLHSDVKARSFRLNSSGIDACHPLVRRMTDMGMRPFGSPTLSDQALMPFPSLKLGPGESCRSHSADEFICISEIAQAIETYLMLI